MTYLTIEKAARHAWPALEEKRLPYGIMRFAQGYTKRSNSLLVMRGNIAHPEELVDNCDEFFGARCQPVIIRIPSFSSAVCLDRYLENQGFATVEPSLVMNLALGEKHSSPVRPLNLDRETWLDACYEISGEPLDHRPVHSRLLQRISGEAWYACLEDEYGAPVCCALAVLHFHVIGLFNIVTAAERRRGGYASALIAALLAWGRARRATHAFLQVEQANRGAIDCYEKQGFRPFYRYWYRVRKKEWETQTGERNNEYH